MVASYVGEVENFKKTLQGSIFAIGSVDEGEEDIAFRQRGKVVVEGGTVEGLSRIFFVAMPFALFIDVKIVYIVDRAIEVVGDRVARG